MDLHCVPYAASQFEWPAETEKKIFEQAVALQTEQKTTQAEQKYRELTSSNSNRFAVFFNLALCEASVGNLSEAESHLKESLRFNPQNRETYKALSSVQEALGKHAEALASHNHFLKL